MKTKTVQCPMCGGMGGEKTPILDDGSGPWEECGYCGSTGRMKKSKLYYQCLGWLSADKRGRLKRLMSSRSNA